MQPGPGTIVGSAAFNLFIISGLCISALPPGEIKKIDKYSVFMLTSIHSLIAYIWLVIIVTVVTPNMIEIWEALVTIFFLPWMITWVYCADRNWFRDDQRIYADMDVELGKMAMETEDNGKDIHGTNSAPSGPKEGVTKSEPRDHNGTAQGGDNSFEHSVTSVSRGADGEILRDENGKPIRALPKSQNKSRAEHKRAAMRGLTAPQSKAQVRSMTPADHNDDIPRVSFLASKVFVLENVGNASIGVMRTGPINFALDVNYKMTEGTAKVGKDFEDRHGVLSFAANQEEAEILVRCLEGLALHARLVCLRLGSLWLVVCRCFFNRCSNCIRSHAYLLVISDIVSAGPHR